MGDLPKNNNLLQWIIGALLVPIGIAFFCNKSIQPIIIQPNKDTITVINNLPPSNLVNAVPNPRKQKESPQPTNDRKEIITQLGNPQQQPSEIKKEEGAINPGEFINEATSESDIAIIIVDNNKQSINSISSDIANLYRSSNHSVTTSLFTTAFFHSKYLDELINSNTQLIAKLNLSSHAKYIIVGKYSNAFETGDYTKFISRATLDVVIISCVTKSQIDGFTLSATNGYDDKEHAEKGAKEKLILDYKRNHLNL